MAGDQEYRDKLKVMGSELRERRESLGISIEEASSKTKLRARYLLAVEDGDDNVAPGSTYFKAFLKTYATFLGLDGSTYSMAYQAALEEKDAPPRPRPKSTPQIPPASQDKTSATAPGRTTDKPVDRPTERPVERPAEKPVERSSAKLAAVPPARAGEESSRPPQMEQPRSDKELPPVPYTGPGDTVRTLQSEYNPVPTVRELPSHRPRRRRRSGGSAMWILLILLIAASAYYVYTTRFPDKVVPPDPPISGEPNDPGTPPDNTEPPSPPEPKVVRTEIDAEDLAFTVDQTPIELLMSTLASQDGNCWIRVKVDGELAYEKTLSPGSQEIVTAESSIEIRSGKPWVMSLSINGQDQGLAGEFGPVRDITITATP